MPLSIPFSHRSNHRIISAVRSMFGPGRQLDVEACDHGPSSSRSGAVIVSNDRSAMLVYPSAQPPTIIVAASIRVGSSRVDP